MTAGGPAPHGLQGLPTLSEVVEMPAVQRPASEVRGAGTMPPIEASAIRPPAPRPSEFGSVEEAALVEAVLADLQRHADLLLEYRLREALAPALARLSDALIRDLQVELATTMRDVVAYAVSQQLARRRGR